MDGSRQRTFASLACLRPTRGTCRWEHCVFLESERPRRLFSMFLSSIISHIISYMELILGQTESPGNVADSERTLPWRLGCQRLAHDPVYVLPLIPGPPLFAFSISRAFGCFRSLGLLILMRRV